jgi:hypothetical protein
MQLNGGIFGGCSAAAENGASDYSPGVTDHGEVPRAQRGLARPPIWRGSVETKSVLPAIVPDALRGIA